MSPVAVDSPHGKFSVTAIGEMQRELFQDLDLQDQRVVRPRTPVFPGRFVRVKVAYEDLIFGGLSLLLLLLAGFCLGVERGRHLADQGIAPGQFLMAEAATDRSLPAVSVSQAVPIPLEALQVSAPVSAAPAASSVGKRYAIQLASYAGARSAHREAQRLARKGFQAEVLKQGRYFELRAAGYPDRGKASEALLVLKKWYHDAFIKTVSVNRGDDVDSF